ncbi:MAG: hypothetical protein AAF577_07550 [Pseudomonadota bacterium]
MTDRISNTTLDTALNQRARNAAYARARDLRAAEAARLIAIARKAVGEGVAHLAAWVQRPTGVTGRG